jgi:Outer membrane receptor for ferrienterochelin and colicins
MKELSSTGMSGFFSFIILLLLSGIYGTEQNGQNDGIDISLQELLNAQVTTASKSAEKLSDAPGVITVVSKDELNRFGGNTLRDVLERVPSLSFATAFFQDRSLISVRGDQFKVTSGHVLLLLNGRPVRESMEGGITSEMFESFPIGIIERIEVVRGPGSVLYGSNAFSGIINIITEDAGKIGGSVSGLGGIKGEWGTNGDFRLKSGDLKVLIAGRMADQSWDTRYTQSVPNTTIPMKTLNLTIPDEQLGSYANIDYKGLKIQSSYDRWRSQCFLRSNLTQTVWTKFFNDVGYSLDVVKNWNMSFNVTYTKSTLVTDTGYPCVDRNSYDLVSEWTNNIQLSDKSKLVVGGLFNQIRGHEDFTGTSLIAPYVASDGYVNAYAGYAQIDYWLLQSLKLIGGLQANKAGKLDLDLVPRVGAIWYPFAKVSFKTLYGEAYRAPSINELGVDHPGLIGNPDLKPEKVGTIDIGVNYNADNLQAGLNYFRSKQNDIIASAGVNPKVFQNLSEVTYQGAEFEGKYYLSTAFYLTGSMLYQTNEDQSHTKNIVPTSNYYKKIGMSYMDNSGITLSVFDIFNNGLDTAFSGTTNPGPQPLDLLNVNCEFNITKYFKLHASPEFALNFYMENLMNTKYWMPEWGGIAHQTIPASPGRRIYLSAKVAL